MLVLLLQIFNALWIAEVIPKGWMVAHVLPLLKPGNSALFLQSFRPVSINSCMEKATEKLVNERLQWRLEVSNNLPQNMTEFQRCRCTVDSILDLVTH
uniref:Reverse transcriptase, putative n=1 Tax=Ixodes scapularis TaxID=6945 RepID=A0A1S4LGJ4_IXOSC